MSDLNSEVIRIIRKRRIEKNLSQEKLSDLSGLDSKYINKLENGRFNLTLPTLARILGGLQMTVVEFFSFFKRNESDGLDELINKLNGLEVEKRDFLVDKFTGIIDVIDK